MESTKFLGEDATARIKRLERMTADYWRQMTRTGGAYVPPKRMAEQASQTELPDRDSEAFQRLSWDALRRSLNGLINKVNASNIKEIVAELIGENLVRGRGLFAKSIMKAQAASIIFSPVYAALVAVLNTKFPMLGELLITRLVSLFRRSYKRNDKAMCVATTTFLAHLVNQKVLHDICILQMLMLLLDQPTEDSVEIAVAVMKECGAALGELSPKPTNAVFERFRAVLHEGIIDKRVQYMIEVLFQIRKEGFREHPAVPSELDLVEEEDQITHYVMLDDELDPQDGLNLFRFDPDFLQHEEEYDAIKREILGDGEEQEEDEEVADEQPNTIQPMAIKDETDANLISFRKTVYLTIMSSLDFEECGHKIMKMNLPEGFEPELCNMIVECCSNERNYLKFYGLLAERFCKIDEKWREHFEQCFVTVYQTIHRMETNKIRNTAKLFGHLFESDAITWAVLSCIRLTEEDTTAAGRIMIKFLLQELAEFYGIPKLKIRFLEADFQEYFDGIFPLSDPVRLRFSINFMTAIGLAGLTDEMRERLDALQPGLYVQGAELSAARIMEIQRQDQTDSENSENERGEEEEEPGQNRHHGKHYRESPDRRREGGYSSRHRHDSRSPQHRRRSSRSRSRSPRRDSRQNNDRHYRDHRERDHGDRYRSRDR